MAGNPEAPARALTDSARLLNPRSSLRAMAIVAWFEVQDALRSRKALALLTLYVAGSAAAASIFLRVLQEIERNAAQALRVAATERPGTMTAGLLESDEFRQAISNMVDDPALVDALVAIPPMALFYGWLSFSFLPGLVMLTSADAIAAEVQSGEARYALVRVDRLSWALGKLGGQAGLMGLGILLGAAAVWIVGAVGWAGFQEVPTALWMARLAGRAWVYGFAWLGLAMAVSQVTATSAGARALGLITLVAMGIVGGILDWSEIHVRAPVLAETLMELLPRGHELGLWHPDPRERITSAVLLLAMGVAYFAVGHQRLARRDV